MHEEYGDLVAQYGLQSLTKPVVGFGALWDDCHIIVGRYRYACTNRIQADTGSCS